MNQNTKYRRSRRQGRWSAMDTVILLLILLAVAGVVYRVIAASRESEKQTATAMYEVYFTVEETHEDVLAEVAGFDAVYLRENDKRIGYIGVYEDTITGEHQVALSIAEAVGATGDNRATATGCLICTEGTMTNGGLLVEGSGRYLTPGSMLEIRTDRALLHIRITQIRTHT